MKQGTTSKSQKRVLEKAKEQIAKGEYTAEERARISRYLELKRKMPPKFRDVEKNGQGGTDAYLPVHSILDKVNVSESVGSVVPDVRDRFLAQAALTLSDSEGLDASVFNYTITLLHGIGPRNELEGMLAVQIVGIHNLMMLTMRRVAHSQLTERTNEYVNQMSKLARAFNDLVECLNRYRGKGQQKMTVEHVHVNKGGQAIVGNVGRDQGGV